MDLLSDSQTFTALTAGVTPPCSAKLAGSKCPHEAAFALRFTGCEHCAVFLSCALHAHQFLAREAARKPHVSWTCARHNTRIAFVSLEKL